VNAAFSIIIKDCHKAENLHKQKLKEANIAIGNFPCMICGMNSYNVGIDKVQNHYREKPHPDKKNIFWKLYLWIISAPADGIVQYMTYDDYNE